MALELTLVEWKAAEVARLSGVSPDLQRQWRRLGVLTPLADKKKSRFNIITVSYVVAARALIDNGAGHRNIQRLINGLGAQILNVAALHGEVSARASISKPEVESQLRAWALPTIASHIKQRYFAFRNDEAALESPYRAIGFNHFTTFEAWLRTGIEHSEFDDEINVLGEQIETPPLTPEELAEDEAWALQNPPSPPLPAATSAVILDVEAIAEQLLEAFGRVYAEVWDNERDPGSTQLRDASSLAGTISRTIASMDSLLARHEDLIAKLNNARETRSAASDTGSAVSLDQQEGNIQAQIDENLQVLGALDARIDQLISEHKALLESFRTGRDSAQREGVAKPQRYRVDTLDLGRELKRADVGSRPEPSLKKGANVRA